MFQKIVLCVLPRFAFRTYRIANKRKFYIIYKIGKKKQILYLETEKSKQTSTLGLVIRYRLNPETHWGKMLDPIRNTTINY
jgi:hypothetical protein